MFSKLAIYAAIAIFMSGGAFGLVKLHDARVVAAVAAKEAAINLETERRDHANLVAALTDRAEKAEAYGASMAQIKEAIAHAKISNACIRSAPISAAVNGLRNLSGNAGAASRNP